MSSVYSYNAQEKYSKELLKQGSFIGKLEQQICNALNLDKDFQHDLCLFEEKNKGLENLSTGILKFAKESIHGPGTKLDLIYDTLRDFYKSAGFEVNEISRGNHKHIDGLSIPKDYYKHIFISTELKAKNTKQNKNPNKFQAIPKPLKKYSIQISQGDFYSVCISESKL
ncbi:MAG: hypothetical protein ACP5OG_04005 [Candidatus Nanoarchaeia archaeon]